MTTKSKAKSNNQTRGGKRLGAGRPRVSGGGSQADGHHIDRRGIAVEIALAGLDHALKAYNVDHECRWTPIQQRWHLAMVLFGVSTETMTAALFKPRVSNNFSRDVADAIKSVEAQVSA